jgi:hypothetical protein
MKIPLKKSIQQHVVVMVIHCCTSLVCILTVVGSGPTRIPGKSRPTRYLMKDVFPTLYNFDLNEIKTWSWLDGDYIRPFSSLVLNSFLHTTSAYYKEVLTCIVPTIRPEEGPQNRQAIRVGNGSDRSGRKFPMAISFSDKVEQVP